MLQIDIKTNGYRPSRMDQSRLDLAIAHIGRLTDTYPDPRLHVTIERVGHTDECQVRMILGLSRRQLVAAERGAAFAPAAQRCVDTLSEQILRSKSRVQRRHGERAIRRAKEEAGLFDPEKLREARRQGDLELFDDALGELHDMLEAEIGRRLKFHPLAEELLGDRLVIGNIVAAVVRGAYDNFEARPENVSFREWILGSVDDVIDQAAAEAA